jgi:hypothetical protein
MVAMVAFAFAIVFVVSLVLGAAWNLFAPSLGLPTLDVWPAFGLTALIATFGWIIRGK